MSGTAGGDLQSVIELFAGLLDFLILWRSELFYYSLQPSVIRSSSRWNAGCSIFMVISLFLVVSSTLAAIFRVTLASSFTFSFTIPMSDWVIASYRPH